MVWISLKTVRTLRTPHNRVYTGYVYPCNHSTLETALTFPRGTYNKRHMVIML